MAQNKTFQTKKSITENSAKQNISQQNQAENIQEDYSDQNLAENFANKQFLEEEIASRYYFQDGRLEASLKDDKEIAEAFVLLNDTEKYTKILTTPGVIDKAHSSPDKSKEPKKGKEN